MVTSWGAWNQLSKSCITTIELVDIAMLDRCPFCGQDPVFVEASPVYSERESMPPKTSSWQNSEAYC